MAEPLDQNEALVVVVGKRNQLNAAQSYLNSIQNMTVCDVQHRPTSRHYRGAAHAQVV